MLIYASKCDYGCVWSDFVKIIMEYFEVKWLCKMMRRTKYCLLILRTDLRGEPCGKQGVKTWTVGYEQIGNRGLVMSELVLFGLLKNYYFWWVDRSISYLPNAF